MNMQPVIPIFNKIDQSQINNDLPLLPLSQPPQTKPDPLTQKVDTSKLTDEEKKNLGMQLVQQTQQKINHFQLLRVLWLILYTVLGALSVIGNITAIALSSQQIQSYVALQSDTNSMIIAVSTAISTFCLTLNAQLQSKMHAVYFQEAVEKYKQLLITIWLDLDQSLTDFQDLASTYTDNGVGVLFNPVALIQAVTGSTQKQQKGFLDKPKQYAYPKPNH